MASGAIRSKKSGRATRVGFGRYFSASSGARSVTTFASILAMIFLGFASRFGEVILSEVAARRGIRDCEKFIEKKEDLKNSMAKN